MPPSPFSSSTAVSAPSAPACIASCARRALTRANGPDSAPVSEAAVASIVPTASRVSIENAAALCACASLRMCAIGLCDDLGCVPAMPLNMSLTSSPACRVNTERPPGCVKAEKSTTRPSQMSRSAPFEARRATSSRVYVRPCATDPTPMSASLSVTDAVSPLPRLDRRPSSLAPPACAWPDG